MLKLEEIVKDYKSGDGSVRALDGINLQFRRNEFVSVLGASGCGKTTLLNIIGGLDRYTSGKLTIEGQATDTFKAVDWDLYRNQRIGFIFQSYNLIPQISILANVELALTLSGVSSKDRRKRAVAALEKVGLGKEIKKRPNQLSGGQMQRVSIARALINNPEIILADEPTGALDSVTSVHVMNLLKEIAEDRLVIMVTHNPELAEQYSTRIISMKDGKVMEDTAPYDGEDEQIDGATNSAKSVGETSVAATVDDNCDKDCVAATMAADSAAYADVKVKKSRLEKVKERKSLKDKKKALKSTSMSFWTAVKLSFQNIKSKSGRNVMTVIAGSIGIICVCLVLALSSGLTGYINAMGEDMLGANPMIISSVSVDFTPVLTGAVTIEDMFGKADYPDNDIIHGAQSNIVKVMLDMIKTNSLNEQFVNYVKEEIEPLSDAVVYDYGYKPLLLSKVSTNYNPSEGIGAITGGGDFNLHGGDIGNISDMVTFQPYVAGQYYDFLAGHEPRGVNEIVLVVSGSNTVSDGLMASIGLYQKYVGAQSIVDMDITLKMVLNDSKYVKGANGRFHEIDNLDGEYATLYNTSSSEDVVDLKIVGVARPKKGSMITAMSNGIAYHSSLMSYVQDKEADSQIVIEQEASKDRDVITGDKLYAGILSYVMDKASGFTSIYDSEVMEIITDFYSGLYPIHGLYMAALGGSSVPVNVNVYTMSYETKNAVIAKVDEYNELHKTESITYTDSAAMMTSMMSNIVDVLSIVLICFTSVSLVVSSVMIGIITYISVVERTKEIGILRSLGARKSDVARVFIAESLMIGLASGILGVLLAYLISVPINLGLATLTAGISICTLQPLHAFIMVVVSAVLTVIAGSIPSYIASKRDPVIALRGE
ncbi:MAG: ATP-binding cassette domain-containing protein [Clostridia bacterium]|nr:ATP-binding cassette domain-containing protein [Clostridia bacterium]